MKMFYEKDTDVNLIKEKKIAIFGYGSQGHAHALNLRDSGVKVIVGAREGGSSEQQAKEDGFNVFSIQEAVKNTDIIAILLPDQVMAKAYDESIAQNLSTGQTLQFAHGYNIHYGKIVPPKDIDVMMVAPSGAGKMVRQEFEKGSGVPNLIAIHQDYSGSAFDMALSYSKAIGGTRSAAFKSTFKEETETDLFGEQTILTGGLPKLLQSSFKVLLERGYSPVVAWFVCYYELKTIVDMFHQNGFEYLNNAISDTAEYGGITRGKRVINESVENEMRHILKEIQSGDFHKEWQKESENNFPMLTSLRKEEKQIAIEEIGQLLLKDIFSKNN